MFLLSARNQTEKEQLLIEYRETKTKPIFLPIKLLSPGSQTVVKPEPNRGNNLIPFGNQLKTALYTKG